MVNPIRDVFWGKLSCMLNHYRNGSIFMLFSTRKCGLCVFLLKEESQKNPKFIQKSTSII